VTRRAETDGSERRIEGVNLINRSTTMIVRSSLRRFAAGAFAAAVTLGGILIAHAHHLA
jgi:hypothetical protein